MRGVARPNVGWQGRRQAEGDVTHCGVARRLSLLLSISIGMWITRDGVSELQFSSVAKGIQLGRCKRCVAKRGHKPKGVPTGSAGSRSDGIGTVGIDEAAGAGVAAVSGPGRGRGTRGGVLARLADGLGAPPKL